jgi:hypothetical protein
MYGRGACRHTAAGPCLPACLPARTACKHRWQRVLPLCPMPRAATVHHAGVAFATAAAAEAAISLASRAVGAAVRQQGGVSPQQLYFCQRMSKRSCAQASPGWLKERAVTD